MKYNSMRKRNFMIWFMMLGLYFSCASPGQSPQRASRRGAPEVVYSEDLSALRRSEEYKLETPEKKPVQTPAERPQGATAGPLMASMDVTNQLENLLTESAERNKETKTLPGYTIQVYLGTSREAAEKAKKQIYVAVPEARPEIRFVQPNYRVLVGRFVERMEAHRTYSQIKEHFPNALIIPDRIQINE